MNKIRINANIAPVEFNNSINKEKFFILIFIKKIICFFIGHKKYKEYNKYEEDESLITIFNKEDIKIEINLCERCGLFYTNYFFKRKETMNENK